MFLSKVIEPLTDVRLMGGDVEINGITYDSRKVEPGTLFVAFKGGTFDGHDFIPDAVARGASAVVVEKEVETSIPTVIVPDSRAALSLLAANFFGYPSRKMTLVGVTGTNGKTTTTHLVQSIFQAAGKKSGLIGTLGARINNQVIETEHTTPESSDLQRVLVKMVDEGVEVVTMEVSSHGLVQGRTDYCEFD
ncbi:MAG TPA: Mur ligase family protein, partial [Armatimonadota bacterium]|nr:Mur ligase family protein [Armatimonadota bacterium]